MTNDLHRLGPLAGAPSCRRCGHISMIDFARSLLPAGLSLNPLAQAVVLEVAMWILLR
jgi:hypothetical protein